MIIFLTLVLYIITGVWLCYKRDWYQESEKREFICVLAVILAPLNLLWNFVQVFLIDNWKK